MFFKKYDPVDNFVDMVISCLKNDFYSWEYSHMRDTYTHKCLNLKILCGSHDRKYVRIISDDKFIYLKFKQKNKIFKQILKQENLKVQDEKMEQVEALALKILNHYRNK